MWFKFFSDSFSFTSPILIENCLFFFYFVIQRNSEISPTILLIQESVFNEKIK